MRFQGKLLLPSDHGSGIDVTLSVGEGTIVLSTGEEELGAWPMTEVEVTRTSGGFFALSLGSETLEFLANDRLRFAYEGMENIERQQRQMSKGIRGAAKRRKATRTASAANAQPSQAQVQTTEPEPQVAEAPTVSTDVPPKPGTPTPIDVIPELAKEPLNADPFEPAEPANAPDTTILPDQAEAVRQETESISGDAFVPDDKPAPHQAATVDQSDSGSMTIDLGALGETQSTAETPDVTRASKSKPRASAQKPKGTSRFRKQKEEHVHAYTTSTFGGGMVRRVCAECHHVSIGSD